MQFEEEKAASAIRAQLSPGEKLVWSGRPKGGLRLRSSDAFLIPFSLVWGGFAVFWNFNVWRLPATNAATSSKLFGVPFLLMGVYIVFGRFFVDAWTRGRTFYGVTNERVIIAGARSVRSLPARTLSEIHLTEKKDGSGTILFGPQLRGQGFIAEGGAGSSRNVSPAFAMIEEARKVYELIRKAQKEAE